MSWKDAMGEAASLTEPTDLEVARVRGRLGLEPTTDVLQDMPEPSPAMVARVRGRLQERPRRWAVPVVPGLALAAVALLAVGLWWRGPAVADAEPTTVALGEGSQALASVRVEGDGVGEATGAGTDWTVDWTRGALSVEVPADGTHAVVVHTPEAEVRVVGTVFDVDRDALGTRVAVDRGTVEVTCALEGGATLTKGMEHTCLPATASGLLGRARALGDADEGPEAVLGALDRGLALDASAPIRGELFASRIGPLVALERPADALQAAESYLALELGTRDAQIRKAAAALALQVEGCDRALPHLKALSAPTPAEAAQLQACEAR